MTKSHWNEYYRAWPQLTPPLRPNHEVVAAVKQEIRDVPGRTLLLGVTPELADVAVDLVAVDRNPSLISHVWPGNTTSRRAIVGDWLNANFAPGSFSACIGDGSIAMVDFPHGMRRLCERICDALKEGGRFAGRVYLAPDAGETIATVREAAVSGAVRNFHAFKLRLAMALAAETGRTRIPVREIFSAFCEMFADRADLVRVTGWDSGHINTIDYYESSPVAYHFPTQRQLRSAIPDTFCNVRFVAAGTFELAERCPLLAMDKARR
jgi:hypothetical protein